MIPCVLGQQGFLAVVRWVGVFHEHLSFKCGDSEVVPPSPVSPCFVSMTGACLSSTRGLMAGLPGFACYGSSLHLGAGCQYWKLLDASVTQLPLCNALIKEGFIVVIVDQAGNFGHESFDRCLLVTS